MVNIENPTNGTLVSTNGVPIIDLAGLSLDTTPSKQWFDNIAKQINKAFSTKGIFFLVNHGIPEKRFRSANKIMEQFCALPGDVKEKYLITSPDDPQGYNPVGMERLGPERKMEVRHCYNIQSFSRKIPSKEIPAFEEEIGALSEDYHSLAKVLLQAIALSLGLNPEVFLSLHQGMMKKGSLTSFRMMYYPSIVEEPSEDTIRCGEHVDWGTIVMLNQDLDGGLEVLLDGKWKRVGFLPGAVFVNVGEVLEKWSDFQYRALLHRVVIPDEPELRCKDRHSVGFFVFADHNTLVDRSAVTTVETSEGRVTKDHDPAVRTVFQHVVNRLSVAYTGSNQL